MKSTLISLIELKTTFQKLISLNDFFYLHDFILYLILIVERLFLFLCKLKLFCLSLGVEDIMPQYAKIFLVDKILAMSVNFRGKKALS